MGIFLRINHFLASNRFLTYLLLFFVSFAFFSWLQSAPTFADPDSFYHVKMAQLMADQGIIRDFPYLPFTTLKNGYIDHHFLYHLYLVPFVKFLPPFFGAKLAHIILDSFVILAFFWLLKKLKIAGAFWYAIFLFFCEAFIFRISLIKAQPFSLIIVFVSLALIISQKRLWLFFLSFIYVWAYGGWFLLPVMVLTYAGVVGLEAVGKKIGGPCRFDWSAAKKIGRIALVFVKSFFGKDNLKLMASVLLGATVGLIINPFFPKNLEFYYIHIIKIAFLNLQSQIGVGAEWYPYSAIDLLKNSALPLILSILALVIFLNHYRRLDLKVKYLLALAVLFFLATAKSRRNIEYLVPMMTLFSASVFSAALKIKEIRDDMIMIFLAIRKTIFQEKAAKIIILPALILVVIFLAWRLPLKVKDSLDNGIRINFLENASNYLSANSREGDVVFHSDWDDFPELFYYNSKNYYIIGLDPTFMYLYDQRLYRNWVDITLGKRADEAYDIIKRQFGAKFVLVNKQNKKMAETLNNNINFVRVYEDEEAIIFKAL